MGHEEESVNGVACLGLSMDQCR